MSTTGAVTGYIDVAQITLYVFWVFFAGLIYYLHRENKREGYPLETDRPRRRGVVQGWPPVPSPKTFLLADGSTVSVPNSGRPARPINATPSAWPGGPIEPNGNPMLAGVGPGSYADRADIVEQTYEGDARIVPLRAANGFDIATEDVDPRGLPVIGADGMTGGTVRDLWVDRSEILFRYLEVSVPDTALGPSVLLPINFACIDDRRVRVASVLGAQLAGVPRTRHPDQVTRLEEERITAYFGAGTLYAEPGRAEPML